VGSIAAVVAFLATAATFMVELVRRIGVHRGEMFEAALAVPGIRRAVQRACGSTARTAPKSGAPNPEDVEETL
jgi:hypothetical protein